MTDTHNPGAAQQAEALRAEKEEHDRLEKLASRKSKPKDMSDEEWEAAQQQIADEQRVTGGAPVEEMSELDRLNQKPTATGQSGSADDSAQKSAQR